SSGSAPATARSTLPPPPTSSGSWYVRSPETVRGSPSARPRPTTGSSSWRGPSRSTAEGVVRLSGCKRTRSGGRPEGLGGDRLALGPALGPVLWQLPERLRFDADVLDAFLARLPRTTTAAAELATRHDDKVPDDRALTTADEERPLRYALEFRSPTFATPEA